MSKEQLLGLMQDALKTAKADQAEMVAVTTDSALTWYAENTIHQNVAEHGAQIQVRAVVGKKVGSASTTDCTPDGLALVVRQAGEAARLMPDNPDFPGLPMPQPLEVTDLGGWVAATAACTPADRVSAVKNIIEVYASNARKHERVGEWIERVGWERFFSLTGIPFTDQHIDDFDLATETFRSSTQFKWR